MSERKRIQLLPFNSVEIDTEGEYAIHGLIPAEGLAVCYGAPKSLKSFYVYDMAMHVALGWDYRGRVVQQGAVVYCAFEGGRGFKKRCAAFRQYHLKDDAQPVPFYLQSVRLDLIKDVKALVEAITEQLDGHARLVVLDTLNRSLVGSESKDTDMSAYLAAADMIRERFHCAVIIVHHSGIEAGRPRGHTSLAGAADAQLAVKRSGKVSTLTVEFMKDGEEGATLTSCLKIIDLGIDQYGEPITSGVLLPTEASTVEAGSTEVLPSGSNNKIALDALTKALLKDGKTPPASNDIPPNTPCVSETLWHSCIFNALPLDEVKRKNQAVKRCASYLIANHYVGHWDGLVWNKRNR